MNVRTLNWSINASSSRHMAMAVNMRIIHRQKKKKNVTFY